MWFGMMTRSLTLADWQRFWRSGSLDRSQRSRPLVVGLAAIRRGAVLLRMADRRRMVDHHRMAARHLQVARARSGHWWCVARSWCRRVAGRGAGSATARLRATAPSATALLPNPYAPPPPVYYGR